MTFPRFGLDKCACAFNSNLVTPFKTAIKTVIVLVCVAALFYTTLNVARATQVSEMVGVWRSGDDPYYLWVGSSWDGFLNKWKEVSASKLRLVDVERYVEDGEVKLAGVWRGGGGGHHLWLASNWNNFTKKWEDLGEQGFRLIDIETWASNGERRYLGVWRSGKGRYALWAASSWSDFTDKWRELSNEGQRLIDVEGYRDGGVTKYLGVFRGGKDGHFLWKADSWSHLVDKWKESSGRKLRLIDFERVTEGRRFKYIGVFRSGSDGHILWRSKPREFFDKWGDASTDGLRLVDLELIVSGGKPAQVSSSQGKPVLHGDCGEVGPCRFKGKQLKGIAYGANHSRSKSTSEAVIGDSAVVKLVGGVCVQEGEVEYTLHYRSTAHRPVPMVATLKAGQCRCHWTNRAKGWPFEYKVLSTVKVKSAKARYAHRLSVCYTPWRKRCEIHTWEGWK